MDYCYFITSNGSSGSELTEFLNKWQRREVLHGKYKGVGRKDLQIAKACRNHQFKDLRFLKAHFGHVLILLIHFYSQI